jgi:hypothetical protein
MKLGLKYSCIFIRFLIIKCDNIDDSLHGVALLVLHPLPNDRPCGPVVDIPAHIWNALANLKVDIVNILSCSGYRYYQLTAWKNWPYY